MKKQLIKNTIGCYEQPATRVIELRSRRAILSASNGEDLNMSVYGNRDDDDDDVTNFWI